MLNMPADECVIFLNVLELAAGYELEGLDICLFNQKTIPINLTSLQNKTKQNTAYSEAQHVHFCLAF